MVLERKEKKRERKKFISYFQQIKHETENKTMSSNKIQKIDFCAYITILRKRKRRFF